MSDMIELQPSQWRSWGVCGSESSQSYMVAIENARSRIDDAVGLSKSTGATTAPQLQMVLNMPKLVPSANKQTSLCMHRGMLRVMD
jgi:hypothetical protein